MMEKYFHDSIEFPHRVADNPLPLGVLWENISSTFLNGFVNYTDPVFIFVIDRYTDLDWGVSADVYSEDSTSPSEWTGTKKELINSFISGAVRSMHTNLRCFEDDIIIVSKIESESNDNYMFFRFDMDVSGCQIGKFQTEDSEDVIKKSIIDSLEKEKQSNAGTEVKEDCDNGIIGYHELPIDFIKGWVKF